MRLRPAPGAPSAPAPDQDPLAPDRSCPGAPRSPNAEASAAVPRATAAGDWRESILLAALGGVVILGMTLPAFGT